MVNFQINTIKATNMTNGFVNDKLGSNSRTTGRLILGTYARDLIAYVNDPKNEASNLSRKVVEPPTDEHRPKELKYTTELLARNGKKADNLTYVARSILENSGENYTEADVVRLVKQIMKDNNIDNKKARRLKVGQEIFLRETYQINNRTISLNPPNK